MAQLSSVFHPKVLRMPKIFSIQWVELMMSLKPFPICTGRLMETLLLENRRIDNMSGSLTIPNIDLDMERREYSMVQQWLSIVRDLRKLSQKQLSSRKQLRTTKLLHLICLDSQRTLDRVKLIEAKNSFTVSKTFKEPIHGMLQDASMESHLVEMCCLTTTLARVLSQTAGTL